MKPRQIKIFLCDGDPDGMRKAQINNAAIQAIAFRKNQLSEVRKKYPQIEDPGVYILIGSEGERHQAYIGESEAVGARLAFHRSDSKEGRSKAYWEDTVALISKDENLTKSHVRYIESKLIGLGINELRWTRPKGVNPSPNAGKLPSEDQAVMDEFVEQAKVLIGVLGWDLFRDRRVVIDPPVGETNNPRRPKLDVMQKFSYKGRGIDATLVIASGEYVVLKGSRARIDDSESAGDNIKAERSSLVAAGTLAKEGDSLVFTSDYKFKSPSGAASVVAGANKNGRLLWKLPNKTTLAEWEQSN